MEGYKLELTVSPWNGFSGVYTESALADLETLIRRMLDDTIGYMNDRGERNYEITREDWK